MDADTENAAGDEAAQDDDAVRNDASGADAAAAADSENVSVDKPAFPEATAGGNAGGKKMDLSRFQDIKVQVSAELGRTEVPIQSLMELGEGSVLELKRDIDSPVQLVAQGVPLASGEVVVVDGCFAIRVTEVIDSPQK